MVKQAQVLEIDGGHKIINPDFPDQLIIVKGGKVIHHSATEEGKNLITSPIPLEFFIGFTSTAHAISAEKSSAGTSVDPAKLYETGHISDDDITAAQTRAGLNIKISYADSDVLVAPYIYVPALVEAARLQTVELPINEIEPTRGRNDGRSGGRG